MTKAYIPEAGDVVWVHFDPRVGHEQSGRRPALVLSTMTVHRRTGMAVICPITSKVKGVSFELPFNSGKISGSLLVLQVRSVDIQARQMAFIDRAGSRELMAARRSVGLLVGLG